MRKLKSQQKLRNKLNGNQPKPFIPEPQPTQGLEKTDGVLMPIIRYALIGVGSTLVNQGYISAEQLQSIVGAVMVLGTTGWLVYNKKVRGF